LAKEVAITRGDYQEDEREFTQLLDELRAQFKPVGVAEDLEVQKIALCYWRKRRAVRYEHGAIRKRTGDMREREEIDREEDFDSALRLGSNLERSLSQMGGTRIRTHRRSSSVTANGMPRRATSGSRLRSQRRRRAFRLRASWIASAAEAPGRSRARSA
jgi:hypothetical protein